MDQEDIFENCVINALENYIEHHQNIKPLSEDFFNRIEAIKQKAMNSKAESA